MLCVALSESEEIIKIFKSAAVRLIFYYINFFQKIKIIQQNILLFLYNVNKGTLIQFISISFVHLSIYICFPDRQRSSVILAMHSCAPFVSLNLMAVFYNVLKDMRSARNAH